MTTAVQAGTQLMQCCQTIPAIHWPKLVQTTGKLATLPILTHISSDNIADADTVEPDPEADSGSENTINEVEEPADHKKNV